MFGDVCECILGCTSLVLIIGIWCTTVYIRLNQVLLYFAGKRSSSPSKFFVVQVSHRPSLASSSPSSSSSKSRLVSSKFVPQFHILVYNLIFWIPKWIINEQKLYKVFHTWYFSAWYFTLDMRWVYEFLFQCVITDNGLFSRLVVVVLLNRGISWSIVLICG